MATTQPAPAHSSPKLGEVAQRAGGVCQNQPLTPEDLQPLWAEALEWLRDNDPEAYRLLQGREVRLAEDPNLFTIVADTSLLDQELRPHKVKLLEWMRARSGRRDLNCQVVVEIVEREKVIYAPHDKYEAMLAANPVLETFHVLFPEIDY